MSRRSLRIQEKTVASTGANAISKNSSATATKAGRKRVEEPPSEGVAGREEEKGRPPRKRARKNPSNAAQPLSDVEDEEGEDEDAASTKKKQRMPKQFRKVRGKLGLLERLAKDVPLDVIFEIFCYLDPGDLLRLARTSKDLRGMLMSKASEAICQRAARANVEGLPPCPDDLNEPQYARLLYDAYCYICNHKGRCENVLWTFRARVCKNCVAVVLPLYDDKYLDKQPAEYRNSGILPSERRPELWRATNGPLGIKRSMKHSIRLAIVRSGFVKSGTAAGHKGGEIGWREETEHIEKRGTHEQLYLEYVKIVNQTRKLTEQGWVNIKDGLVELLSEHRKNRLETAKLCVMRARYELLSEKYRQICSKSDCREPYSALGDILTAKVFETLIWDTPVEKVIHFPAKLSEHLPRIIDKWRTAKIQDLLKLVQKSKQSKTLPAVSDLHLATTIFECTECKTAMHYPQMFYHECCLQHQSPNKISHERMEMFRKNYFGYLGYGPWMIRTLVLSDQWPPVMEKLLKACSLDPTTTTVHELRSVNPPIECVTCSSNYRRTVCLWWRHAFSDNHQSHNLKFNTLSKYKQATQRAMHTSGQLDDQICCAHCNQEVRKSQLRNHLESGHKDIPDTSTALLSLDLGDIQEHWYYNPRVPMQSLYVGFYYDEPLHGVVS
ncbi:hypothetical protein EV368DRAFT_82141 [Lentinula lateritia]|nr:hypothetical protein EV368DRAFT_82141 [Lentinula lateritia]